MDWSVERVTGVVDDDVDLAPSVNGCLNQLGRRCRVGQVTSEDNRLAAKLRSRLLRDVAVEIVDQNLRAMLDQDLRRCPADASCAAGDNCHLVVKNAHVHFLLKSIGL